MGLLLVAVLAPVLAFGHVVHVAMSPVHDMMSHPGERPAFEVREHCAGTEVRFRADGEVILPEGVCYNPETMAINGT